MKIGIIVGRFPVISEQFIINHITGLIDRGHEVTILSATLGDRSRVQPMVTDYKLLEKTRYAGMPNVGPKRLFRLPLVFLGNLLRRPIKTLKALAFWRYRTGTSSGKTLFFLNAWGHLRFDLLHAHFGANGLSAAYLKDIGVAPRLAVAFHGSDINSYPRRYGEDVYGYMYSRCDLITANTNFTADKIVANGADRGLIAIIPESLATDRYPRRRPPERTEGFVVLTVGRLVEKKGHRHMLDALARLKGSIPGLQYRMVGDGHLRGELEAQARELGLQDLCLFLGAKTAAEILPEYERCDLFVLPSVTAPSGDMEGQALVLQEAQAVGVPVVSTLHNGIPDGVLEGETGLLVPEADPDALAEAIRALAEDRERLAAMGQKGPEFVRGKYDVAVVTEKLDTSYAERFPEWISPGGFGTAHPKADDGRS